MPLDTAALPEPLAEIHEIVGDKGLVLDPVDMEANLVEWRGMWHGKARAVVKPGTPEEVAAVLKVCNDHRVAVVPQGGNTSLCGGSVPFESGEEIVLSTQRPFFAEAPSDTRPERSGFRSKQACWVHARHGTQRAFETRAIGR